MVSQDLDEIDKLVEELISELLSRNKRYRDTIGKTREIKASELTIEDRVFALSFLKDHVEFEVIYAYISKDPRFIEWLDNKVNKRKTVIYLDNYVIRQALELFEDISQVFIDRSHYIRGGEKYISHKVSFEESWKVGGLQFADLIANALFIKLEPSKRISGPYNVIKDNIASETFVPWKSIKKFRI